MKVIFGLGNYEIQYKNTRHNVGFMVLDNYVGEDNFKKKDNYLYFQKLINGEKVLFVKPLTFMNNSGEAVKRVMNYYKVNIEDILVIYDDMDFDLGKFKLKISGSSGGHNGIKSIIKYLGTDQFNRLRIGISKNEYDVVSYVLGKFSSEELEIMNKVLITANSIIEDYVVLSFEKLMSKYN